VLPFTPFEHQRVAHSSKRRFKVLVWHRRAGKTVFAIVELVLAALACKKERARFAYIAPQLKQAKQVAWDYLKHYTRGIHGVEANEAELSVTLPNGAQIRLFGADNPDSLRGTYFDGVVLDEVAQMRPQTWGEVIRPALADREGWALFIGTPKGVNLFSKTYFDAVNDDRWYADLKRWSDTNVLKPAEVEDARRTMSAALFAQEFECDFFAATTNTLISLESVLEASRRIVTPAEVSYAPKIMGVDVARYGDDKNAIAKRQGRLLLPVRRFGGMDTMEVASQVTHDANEWKPHAIFVDIGGVGAGVGDRLRQLGWNAIDVNFGSASADPRYHLKRTQIWAQMADWLKTASVPNDTVLHGEWVAPTYSYAGQTNKMKLESKDDMRARGIPSPDGADSVATTFSEPVAIPSRPDLDDYEAQSGGNDFDPYEHLGS
jgi:hypothetical protein